MPKKINRKKCCEKTDTAQKYRHFAYFHNKKTASPHARGVNAFGHASAVPVEHNSAGVKIFIFNRKREVPYEIKRAVQNRTAQKYFICLFYTVIEAVDLAVDIGRGVSAE